MMDKKDYAQGILHELEYWRQINEDLVELARKLSEAADLYTGFQLRMLAKELRSFRSFGNITQDKISEKLDEPEGNLKLMEAMNLINGIMDLVNGRMLALQNVVDGMIKDS
jgi:hypothetical protein